MQQREASLQASLCGPRDLSTWYQRAGWLLRELQKPQEAQALQQKEFPGDHKANSSSSTAMDDSDDLPHPLPSNRPTGTIALQILTSFPGDFKSRTGLLNPLYRCFANATMQALIALPQFRSFFGTSELKRLVRDAYSTGKHTYPVLSEVLRLVEAFLRKEPQTSTQHLQAAVGGFPSDVQHDAAEFLLRLRRTLTEELEAASGPPGSSNNSMEVSLEEIFRFHICYRNTCACGATWKTKQEQLLLDFALPLMDTHSGVAGLLQTFLHTEKSMEHLCVACNKAGGVRRQKQITKSAPILVLQLKRFIFNEAKLRALKRKDPITINVHLDLSKSLAPNLQPSPVSKYTLRAIVDHHGNSADSGHYTADVRNQDGTWTLYNDAKVVRSARSDTTVGIQGSETAYLLFYTMD